MYLKKRSDKMVQILSQLLNDIQDIVGSLPLLVYYTFTITLSQKTKIVSNVMYLYIQHLRIYDGISYIKMDKIVMYIPQSCQSKHK